MTLRAIIARLKRRGIRQCRGAMFRDQAGKVMDTCEVEQVRAVCILGALEYAQERQWITQREKLDLSWDILRGIRAVTGYYTQSMVYFNDEQGWTFADFVRAVEQLPRRGRRRPR